LRRLLIQRRWGRANLAAEHGTRQIPAIAHHSGSDDLSTALTAGLSDRYAIERPLGRGGMATVYLARDVKHDRPVALKVLLPELAASLGPERFQREIRLAARLQHPHVLTVHDSGETAGQLWFTMPYVEGESVRDRLRRERQISLDDALRITREAAQALQYAHEHGVVHRDIKPENLLLTKDGNTLVADFGIARALGGDERLTQTGMSVGTPAYMSPEQASGDRSLDARSDVYSLGTVLFEMLAGEPPYTGATAQQIIVKRFTDPVPSVRKVRPSVPEAVDQAVQRALAPVPADRFGSAAEFGRALQAATTGATPIPTPAAAPLPATVITPLSTPVPANLPPAASTVRPRRIPVAALALGIGFLIGLGVLFAWRRNHAGGDDSAGPKRVAVLPFENLGDSADAYFADGITNEVRGKLSQIEGLAVIARASSNEYRGTSRPPQQIARELGADYLLTATVQWERTPGGPSRVRVSPELVRVAPGGAPTTTWQQGFDASLTDVFKVQADIAGKVASALDVALADSARRTLAATPTANLSAYDAFLKGEAATDALASGDPASLRRGIGFYEQAVARDPGFVPAWARLAQARSLLYANSMPTPELAGQAREAVERARTLAPGRHEAQLALGFYHRAVTDDRPKALAAFQAGLKLAPANPEMLTEVALAEQGLGRWDAAFPYLEKAAALDPRSPSTARRIGFTLLWLRRYPEAQAAFDRGLALAPTNITIIQNRAMVALAQGDLAGARTALRTAFGAIDTAAVIAYFSTYWDLYWVLDDAQQQQVLALSPAAFDDDRATWALVRAQILHLRGNRSARAYADTARQSFEEQLRATPDNAQLHALRGLALAYLGRKADAIAEGERGVELGREATFGPYYRHLLARTYLLVGEPEKALDQLEPLLKVPYYLSPGWLRIDPEFAPLTGNPRFERLIAGK
jgi:TolB-like protein/Flp pilus assembly protein TadD